MTHPQPWHAANSPRSLAIACAMTTLTALALAIASAALAAGPPTTFTDEAAADGDQFGAAVDVSGDLLAVGAYSTDLEREDVGAVYLYDLGVEPPAPLTRIVPADGELGDAFGADVAIGVDVLLVGAPGVILGSLNEGAAYVFEHDGTAWAQVAMLRRDAPGQNDMFGGAVDLDGIVAAVGAPGADVTGTDSGVVLVYERTPEGWTNVATLAPEDGTAGARFGSAVAVDGDRILVGASGDVPAGEDPGSAYLFERTPDGWARIAHFTPSAGGGGDAFGDAVALGGDVAVVGARFADLEGSDEGSAYVFVRSDEGWTEAARLTAPEPSDRDQFGGSVAIAGEVVLVGAPRVDDPERDAGAVWTYARDAEGWTLQERLSPEAVEAFDEFGIAVAAEGSVAVVGAPNDIPEGLTDETVTGTVTVYREVR